MTNNTKDIGVDGGSNAHLINFLVPIIKAESYLEIGVRDFTTYDNVVCKEKVWVDPSPKGKHRSIGNMMFSDDYFNDLKTNNVKKRFDIIFIDGDHSYEGTKKDLENAISFLSDTGLIVMHDMDPPFVEWQGKPTDPLPPGWKHHPMGECWKALADRRINNCDVKVISVQSEISGIHHPPGGGVETGLTVLKISKDNSMSRFSNQELDWNFFVDNRNELLNVFSREDFGKNFIKEMCV